MFQVTLFIDENAGIVDEHSSCSLVGVLIRSDLAVKCDSFPCTLGNGG